MDDNEKILLWLNYHEVKGESLRTFVIPFGDPYTAVIKLDRERFFLKGKYNADPELDYLVLHRVRSNSIPAADVVKFLDNLQEIWQKRLPPEVEKSDWGSWPFQFVQWYTPGDYAEAARFLWDG